MPFTVTATDAGTPSPTITCTASGATSGTVTSGAPFAIGTTMVTCTATDAAGNVSAPASFTVTVQGAAAQLAALKTAVGSVPAPYGAALVQLVQSAEQLLAAGAKANACAVLRLNFPATVDSFRRAGGVTSAQATQFTTDAHRIATLLGCP